MAGDPKWTTKKEAEAILKARQAVRLDIGGGNRPNPGFVNIDILPLPKVDIVWDIEKTPWPLADESVSLATASHVLEHINPHKGIFIDVMNEIWRVLKRHGQFAFVVPYAESFGMYQDPTHCNFINEATMFYFDPLHASGYYYFYQPKPWKIVNMPFSRNGLLECLLEKRDMDPSYLKFPEEPSVNDLTKEDFSVKPIRTTEV